MKRLELKLAADDHLSFMPGNSIILIPVALTLRNSAQGHSSLCNVAASDSLLRNRVYHFRYLDHLDVSLRRSWTFSGQESFKMSNEVIRTGMDTWLPLGLDTFDFRLGVTVSWAVLEKGLTLKESTLITLLCLRQHTSQIHDQRKESMFPFSLASI